MITKPIIGDKLVIPHASNMHWSNVAKDNQALCFIVSRGYVETDTLFEMLKLQESLEAEEGIFKLVGNIDKILLDNEDIVYRQRVYFSDIKRMFEVCCKHSLGVEIPTDFHIPMESLISCMEVLPELKKYARQQGETVNTYLVNTCIIHIHCLLKSLGMYSGLRDYVADALEGKYGYMDRAPFLLGNYSFEHKTSTVLLETNLKDTHLYSMPIKERSNLVYGYTTHNVLVDKRKGGTHEGKK